MRKNVCNYLIGVMAVGSVMFSTGVTANPPGVPVGDPPLSCTTVDSKGGGNNYQVEAIAPNGEFPVTVPCPTDPGQKCADYGYNISSPSGKKISQSLFSVSADQELDSASPAPAYVAEPGDGDSTTDFLKYARHEYPVRLNANDDALEAHIYIKGGSSSRVSTAYIRGGKLDESCLIAGPGVAGNPFTPKTVSKDVVAVGGKCEAKLHYNGKGEVVNITNVQSTAPGVTCYADKPQKPNNLPNNALPKFLLGDQPIQDVDAPNGITFGTGTTIVYLPYGWAICTESPCPGPAYYIWVY